MPPIIKRLNHFGYKAIISTAMGMLNLKKVYVVPGIRKISLNTANVNIK